MKGAVAWRVAKEPSPLILQLFWNFKWLTIFFSVPKQRQQQQITDPQYHRSLCQFPPFFITQNIKQPPSSLFSSNRNPSLSLSLISERPRCCCKILSCVSSPSLIYSLASSVTLNGLIPFSPSLVFSPTSLIFIFFLGENFANFHASLLISPFFL